MAVPIPENFRDLFREDKPVFVTLVTVMPSGQPQATPVWIDYDGQYVLVNTARGRQKDKNMQRNAKMTVLAVDPANPYRWIEVRGKIADITEQGALEHINKLAGKYRNGNTDYYAPYPERRHTEQRVIYKIEPTKINTSGR